MTMILNHPETEPGLEIKTWGFGSLDVHVNGRPIPMTRVLDMAFDVLSGRRPLQATIIFMGHVLDRRDFAVAIRYVLTNTNLVADDPRLAFCERVRVTPVRAPFAALVTEICALEVIPGYSGWADGRPTVTTRLGVRGEDP
ncbi:hypothetical protein HY480_04215 [Candidatus Uhrbacteria bacterium]|nr:hypothetical protein [Candidatus Uhrbacteria bacterium]